MFISPRSTTDASVPAAKEFTESTARLVREKNAELSGRDLGWFVNMCQGDENPEDVFGENLPRLRKIKAKYDPNDVFRNPQSVIVPGKLEEELTPATHGKSCGGCVIM